MRELKNKEKTIADEKMTAVQKFKKRLRWDASETWFDRDGLGLLMYAVVANEYNVVSELLQMLKRDFKGDEFARRLESRIRDEGYFSLGVPGGSTTLMAAMMTASSETVSMLLEYGANIQSVDAMGNDAFVFASAYGRPKNLQYWLDRLSHYNLELQNTVLGATPLIIATNLGSNKRETVRLLCDRGAHLGALTHAGFSVLMAACANEDSDPRVVKDILARIDRSCEISVNYRIQSQSIKWKVLRGTAKLAIRCHLVKSVLAKRLAHGPGLTALHYAARRGDEEIVTLLLEAGADPYIENEMGLNSFDINEKFGPFPSVMRVLQTYAKVSRKRKNTYI